MFTYQINDLQEHINRIDEQLHYAKKQGKDVSDLRQKRTELLQAIEELKQAVLFPPNKR